MQMRNSMYAKLKAFSITGWSVDVSLKTEG